MAGRSSSKTLMNLPLRKKALPVIINFFTFFFFFSCEPVKLLHGQAYYCLDMIWGNQWLQGTLRSSISLVSVSWQLADLKQSFIMLSDSMGQNSKDSLALLHNLEGLKISEVLLSHMSGLDINWGNSTRLLGPSKWASLRVLTAPSLGSQGPGVAFSLQPSLGSHRISFAPLSIGQNCHKPLPRFKGLWGT